MSNIQLTNDGFKDFFEDRRIMRVSYITTDGITLGIEETKKGNLYGETRSNNFVSGYLKDGVHTGEMQNYVLQLSKVARRNKINDKDKVYFTKASLFPRTSFNRYSDKARLVQKIPAATKFVLPDHINFSHRSDRVFKFSTADDKDSVLVDINKHSFAEIIRNYDYATLYQKYRVGMDANPNYYSPLDMTADIATPIQIFLKTIEPDLDFVKIKAVNVFRMEGYSKKETDSLEVLKLGKDISSLISDKAANDYIETFKADFDDSTMSYMVEMLNSAGADPEVAMQLICNTKLREFEPKLHALLVQLDRDAYNRIVGNRVMNTVDVKNLISTHNLNTYFNNYYDPDTLSIARIAAILKDESITPALKKEFAGLINNRLSKAFESTSGIAPGTIKMSYEDIEV